MSASTLLQDLRRRGVEVTPEGDRLRCRAPRGVLTPGLRESIRRYKRGLLMLLQREARDGDRDASLLRLIQALDLEPLTWRDALRLERPSAERCSGCGTDRRVLGLPVCADCWCRAKELELQKPGGRRRSGAAALTPRSDRRRPSGCNRLRGQRS